VSGSIISQPLFMVYEMTDTSSMPTDLISGVESWQVES